MPVAMDPRRSKVSDEQLAAAAAGAQSMADLLRRLGISVDGGNYESIRWRLHRLGLLDERFTRTVRRRPAGAPLRDDHCYTDEQLGAAVVGARTKATVLRRLGLPPEPSQYPELNRRLTAAGIDVGHLLGRRWRRGARPRPRIPLTELLARPRIDAREVKRRLVTEGVRARCCEMCGLSTWLGQPIPLELDHVDGDRSDNRLENLRLLCPNCHAGTPTWRGRNIGRGMSALSTDAGASGGTA